MPAHKAPKAVDRTTDRLANLTVATFVVLAVVGVVTDAIARPRPVSRREDWLDDLIGDAEHPERAADQLAHTFSPPRQPNPPPTHASRFPTTASREAPRAPVKPAKHRKPAKPAKARQRHHWDPHDGDERHSYGRQQTGPRFRIPRAMADQLRRLTEEL